MRKETAGLIRFKHRIKTLPSVVSGRPADDSHHIKVKGLFGGTVKPKLCMIPLTRDEHSEFHSIGQDTFEGKYKISQLQEAVITLNRAFEKGWLEFIPGHPLASLLRVGLLGFNQTRPGEVLQALEQLYEKELIIAV